jgi:hypothetical protein
MYICLIHKYKYVFKRLQAGINVFKAGINDYLPNQVRFMV